MHLQSAHLQLVQSHGQVSQVVEGIFLFVVHVFVVVLTFRFDNAQEGRLLLYMLTRIIIIIVCHMKNRSFCFFLSDDDDDDE